MNKFAYLITLVALLASCKLNEGFKKNHHYEGSHWFLFDDHYIRFSQDHVYEYEVKMGDRKDSLAIHRTTYGNWTVNADSLFLTPEYVVDNLDGEKTTCTDTTELSCKLQTLYINQGKLYEQKSGDSYSFELGRDRPRVKF